MSCSCKGRSYRKFYDIVENTQETLGSVVERGNTASRGAYFDGDLETSGFLKGDGSQIENLPAAPNITLQTVVANHNVASIGAYFNGDLEASGYLKGDGSLIENLPVPTLQEATTLDPTTSDTVTFLNLVTSLETSGNVLVAGNVTATDFYGDGSELTSVTRKVDLNDNSSRIGSIEQSTIITNTNGITTDFSKGDILYASAPGTLSKLAISSNQTDVLTVNASGVPEWSAAPSVSNFDTRISSLESNLMVTSTSGITGIQTGDILYASATDTLTRLPAGNAGQYLAINSSGVPEWVNGPTQTTNFITESYPSSGNARIGLHNTNPLHAISFGTSYYEDNPGTFSNLVVTGNVYAEYLYGNGHGITNLGGSGTSDIRIKSNIITVENSLDILSKLKPVMYDKDGRTETGFIAQDIYYDAPEIRHVVIPGKDATPNETKNEPSYDDWGSEYAKLDYYSIMTYTVSAINELREMVEDLENS